MNLLGFRLLWIAPALAAALVLQPAAQAQDTAPSPAPLGASSSSAVEGISLALLLEQAAMSHPSIRGARLDVRAAEQDIETARLSRWPTLSVSLESRGANVATSSARSVGIEQTLWDGGRTAARIAEATTVASMGRARLLAVRQDLWLQVVAGWQSYLGAQGRITVATDTLRRLGDYRATMDRRVQAQASPSIELELVDARILQTRVELNQAQVSRAIAVARLEQLTGRTDLANLLPATPPWPARETIARLSEAVSGADVDTIAAAAPSVEVARFDAEVARHRLAYKEAEKYPQVYARANQPIGSAVVGGDKSMAFFIGLRYTPGAGFSQFSEAKSLAVRASSAEEAVDGARREVVNALRADRAELLAAMDRLGAADSTVTGGGLVLSSYLRQFQAARKTWQDVLNAARELAQNQYSQVDVRASMVGAMLRLQVRLGMGTESFSEIPKGEP